MKRAAVFALLSCLSVVSCVPKAKPVPMVPAPKTVEVAPTVAAIRPSLDRAADAAAALQSRGDALERIATKAKQEASSLAKEARRLADAGAATREELANQAQAAASQREVSDQLAAQLGAEKLDKAAIVQALAEARAAQADALAAAATGDAAQHILSQQVGAVTQQYQDAEAGRQGSVIREAVTAAELHRVAGILGWLQLAVAAYVTARVLKLTPWGRVLLVWLP